MSAFACGDWVWVHPGERFAPTRALGLSGQVTRLEGGLATVVFGHEDEMFSLEVDVKVLHHERRRRNRPPVEWSHGIAATG